jgi:hypothetical protein
MPFALLAQGFVNDPFADGCGEFFGSFEHGKEFLGL